AARARGLGALGCAADPRRGGERVWTSESSASPWPRRRSGSSPRPRERQFTAEAAGRHEPDVSAASLTAHGGHDLPKYDEDDAARYGVRTRARRRTDASRPRGRRRGPLKRGSVSEILWGEDEERPTTLT